MAKNISIKTIIVSSLALITTLIIPSFIFAADTVTITTYYPSPYGSYKQLYVSDKLGIGTTNPIGKLQLGANTFTGGNGVYVDSRIGAMVNGSLTSIVYASTYNDPTYPDYGLVFIHGPSTSSYNVWSISPDGPAKGSNLNFIYGLNASNIHTTTPKVVFQGSTGNVGIGTTNPTYHLQVDGTDNYQFQVIARGTGYGGTTLANIYSERTSAGTDALLKVGSAYAPNTLYVQDSGNVGIGTTAPYTRLVVEGTYSTTLAGKKGMDILGRSSSWQIGDMVGINFRHFGGNFPTYSPDASIGVIMTSSTDAELGDFFIATRPTTGVGDALVERMRITSAGNVGIGTTNPTAHLQVQGNTVGQQIYAISSATSGSNYGVDAEATGSGASANTGVYAVATGATNNYAIYVPNGYPAAGASNYQLYLGSNAKSYFGGSVGIGVTTPATGALLHIYGSYNWQDFVIDTAAPSIRFADTENHSSYGIICDGNMYFYSHTYAARYENSPGTLLMTLGPTGNLSVVGSLSKGSGSFLIDHPLDPKNKVLRHSFVESPDMKNIYDGIAALDKDGESKVKLPDYFGVLNKDFRYQLTPIGSAAGLYIKKEIESNEFVIAGGSPGMKVSWQVTGTRKDPFALKNPVIVEEEKGKNSNTEKGKYIHPDAYAKIEK